MRTFRLAARGGIGMAMLSTVHAEAIERSRFGRGEAREIAIALRAQRVEAAGRIIVRRFFDHYFEELRFWRPDPEMRPSVAG